MVIHMVIQTRVPGSRAPFAGCVLNLTTSIPYYCGAIERARSECMYALRVRGGYVGGHPRVSAGLGLRRACSSSERSARGAAEAGECEGTRCAVTLWTSGHSRPSWRCSGGGAHWRRSGRRGLFAVQQGMVAVDASSRNEVSEVQGKALHSIVGGQGLPLSRVGMQGGRRLGLDGTAGQLVVGRVVVLEDAANDQGRRRCHRGGPSARRHARNRRRSRRCETEWRLLEDGRETAAATSPARPRGMQWRWALSALRWRRSQAVWVAWMATELARAASRAADAAAQSSLCVGTDQVAEETATGGAGRESSAGERGDSLTCVSEASESAPEWCTGGGSLKCSSEASEEAEPPGSVAELTGSVGGGSPVCSSETSEGAQDGARGGGSLECGTETSEHAGPTGSVAEPTSSAGGGSPVCSAETSEGAQDGARGGGSLECGTETSEHAGPTGSVAEPTSSAGGGSPVCSSETSEGAQDARGGGGSPECVARRHPRVLS